MLRQHENRGEAPAERGHLPARIVLGERPARDPARVLERALAVEDIRIRVRGLFDWEEFPGFVFTPGDNRIIRLDNDPNRPEASALAARVIEERGSILHLYAMLMHSIPVAEGWLAFLTAIRQRCALPGAIRELMILEVAHLNGARYEAEQHAPIALREGLTLDAPVTLGRRGRG